ncbi:MAG: hypothetical protein ABI426_10915 [Flavobacterium sp.]
MIAFNKELLNNTVLVNEAENLKNSGFISKDQLNTIEAKLPTLKNHKNILVRIGFFLLGCFLYSSICGTVSIVFLSGLDQHYKILIFLFAIIGFAGSEILAKNKFKSHGLDDAFVLGSQGCLFVAIGVADFEPIAVLIAMAIVGFLCCLRYCYALSALISWVGIVGFFADLIVEEKMINMSFLPFIMLFLAIIIYFVYTKLMAASKIYYKKSLLVIQVLTLLLGYASMNYLVVRELSQELMDFVVTPGTDIPFAFFFYGLTFLIPLFYIVYALLKKDKPMLYVGGITLGFSFYTIRYYYSALPLEMALIIGGSFLFAVSYLAIHKLKINKTGVTFMPDRNENNTILSNLEAVVVNSQVNLKGAAVTEQKMPFGGGGFSGGGSGGSY